MSVLPLFLIYLTPVYRKGRTKLIHLALLPTAYSIAFGCISINTAQLIVQLIRLRLSGSASGVWMVRTGYWERRIKLETESETEKAQM
jgi:hypothetical protein